ncbi:hypothetical protein TGVEG_215055 [Toxoplasma gondii VEG]|uniref:Uncharacterized protein n=1 Tax=Toxoplasma gondii (strain ATCC 50861 / VEG) TaxID=432359 RepID=V5B656_TOXGV|nr:hypothetical protein TGVEG_215055 [Toxoplasma gondii VEG]
MSCKQKRSVSASSASGAATDMCGENGKEKEREKGRRRERKRQTARSNPRERDTEEIGERTEEMRQRGWKVLERRPAKNPEERYTRCRSREQRDAEPQRWRELLEAREKNVC